MARRTFRVSRYGFTACPGCGTHMKIDPGDWKSTVCPFCDAELLARDPGPRKVPGRAGMLAAGLLSLSIAACDDTGDADAGMGTDMAGAEAGLLDADPDPDPDAGPDEDAEVDAEPIEPDEGVEADMELAPDFGIQPEYGKPADDFGVEPEVDMEVAPDFGAAPEYGGPPPDMDAGPAEDMAALPPYGIPPMEDAEVTSDAEQDEAVAVPLYGVPPQEEEA